MITCHRAFHTLLALLFCALGTLSAPHARAADPQPIILADLLKGAPAQGISPDPARERAKPLLKPRTITLPGFDLPAERPNNGSHPAYESIRGRIVAHSPESRTGVLASQTYASTTKSKDRSAAIIDLFDGRVLQYFQIPLDRNILITSPDARRFVLYKYERGNNFYDIVDIRPGQRTPTRIATPPPPPAAASTGTEPLIPLAFITQDRLLAVYEYKFAVVDLPALTPLIRFEGAIAACLSPGANHLYLLTPDRLIAVDPATGSPIAVISTSLATVNDKTIRPRLLVDPSGQRLYIKQDLGNYNHTLECIDLKTGASLIHVNFTHLCDPRVTDSTLECLDDNHLLLNGELIFHGPTFKPLALLKTAEIPQYHAGRLWNIRVDSPEMPREIDIANIDPAQWRGAPDVNTLADLMAFPPTQTFKLGFQGQPAYLDTAPAAQRLTTEMKHRRRYSVDPSADLEMRVSTQLEYLVQRGTFGALAHQTGQGERDRDNSEIALFTATLEAYRGDQRVWRLKRSIRHSFSHSLDPLSWNEKRRRQDAANAYDSLVNWLASILPDGGSNLDSLPKINPWPKYTYVDLDPRPGNGPTVSAFDTQQKYTAVSPAAGENLTLEQVQNEALFLRSYEIEAFLIAQSAKSIFTAAAAGEKIEQNYENHKLMIVMAPKVLPAMKTTPSPATKAVIDKVAKAADNAAAAFNSVARIRTSYDRAEARRGLEIHEKEFVPALQAVADRITVLRQLAKILYEQKNQPGGQPPQPAAPAPLAPQTDKPGSSPNRVPR